MRLLPTLPALFCLLFASSAGAQPATDPELITDRPDQTESSTTVSPGFVQIESGFLRTESDEGSGDASSESVPGTLARIGLTDELELRIGWAGREESEAGGSSADGSGDGELGLKWHLWGESGKRPDAGLLVGTSVPIGSDGISSERFDPSFRFAFAHGLSPRVDLAYNLGYAWETGEAEGGDRRTDGSAVWTVAAGFGVSERLGAFVELFGAVPEKGSADTSMDGGFTWLVRPNFQLDVYGGVGLSDQAPDRLLGFGFAWRLPQ